MGYTHYYESKRKITVDEWKPFAKDVKKIIKHVQSALDIKLEGSEDSKNMIDNTRVFLNGVPGYETFALERDHVGFQFCKTGQEEYDIVVCSILLLTNKYFSNAVDVSSDGDFEDWKEAMELNATVLGSGFELPISMRKNNVLEIEAFESTLKETADKVVVKKPKKTSDSLKNKLF